LQRNTDDTYEQDAKHRNPPLTTVLVKLDPPAARTESGDDYTKLLGMHSGHLKYRGKASCCLQALVSKWNLTVL